MAQSFLPFCAHCEKQIVVPNTSILFCSEKCRRKDQARPPSLATLTGTSFPPYDGCSITPPTTPYAYDVPEDLPLKNYVEPLSPTPPRRNVPIHDYTSIRNSMPTPAPSRSGSGTTTPIESIPGSPISNNANIYMPPRRPQHFRSMTGGSATTLSSLSSSRDGSIPVPTQYQFGQQRPLPPLHRPQWLSTSPRSIELVTPCMSATTPPRPELQRTRSSTDYHYEKRSPTSHNRSGSDFGQNFKALFNFDAIRGSSDEQNTCSNFSESPEKYVYGSNDVHFARSVTFR